jgi:hypothetical protein
LFRFYLTPSLLHISTFLHLHQCANIALKYFHIIHFLNEYIQGIFSLQIQHSFLFSSCKEAFTLSQASQEIIYHIECLLQKFVHVALSNNLFMCSINHSFSMDFLFSSPSVKNEKCYFIQEENSLPFSFKFLFTFLQFQTLTCITAYQCFNSALESLPNQKKYYDYLSNHCLNALPIFLLLLVCMPTSLHRKTKPLIHFFSKVCFFFL